MTKHSRSGKRTFLKSITYLLLTIFIINPVILFLVFGNIWVSIFMPFLLVCLVIFFNENRKFQLLNIILINLLLVFSFFLHAEAIFTYRFSNYIIQDLYDVKEKYYFNRPFLDQTIQDKEYIVQYKTNKQGFRIGVEDDSNTEVDRVDWLFIGDSYTQGAQVQFEELYTSKLFDLFPDKIIINAGISGFGIADEYYYYINEGRKLKAKKVFLQICNFNDFMNVEERTSGFSDYLMHHSNFARFLLYDFKYANPAELPLGRWTEPFYPDEKSNRNYNVYYKKESVQKKKDLKNFAFFLKKFSEEVKKDGGDLIVVQIPSKEQIHYKYFEEVIRSFKIEPSQLDMQIPNKLLEKLCKENKVQHIDLFRDFSASENDLFYQFDEHLNILGHQQMAAYIAAHIKLESSNHNQPVLISKLNLGDRYPNFAATQFNLLTYQSYRDGNMELFVSDSLLQNEHRLTWNSVDELHPWLSPNGSFLVFTEGDQDLKKTKVAFMNLDGSERRYITEEEDTFGAIPSFDHNGTKVTYAEWRQYKLNGKLTNPYIVVYDLRNGNKTIITSDSVENWRPIFSADGEKIYFIAKVNGEQFDIFEYSLKAGTKRNITNSHYEEWDPAISSDGKKLVYSARKNDNWDLVMYEFESGKTKQLTNSLGDEWDPSFSPCGRYLYYAANFGLRNGIFKLVLNE